MIVSERQQRAALGHQVATSMMSSLNTRRVMDLGKFRSDLTLVVVLLLKVEMLELGCLGTVIFGKLPKVKEKQAATSIWMLTLAEKKTPDLAATELAARTPEKSLLPGAPTVGLLIRQVH